MQWLLSELSLSVLISFLCQVSLGAWTLHCSYQARFQAVIALDIWSFDLYTSCIINFIRLYTNSYRQAWYTFCIPQSRLKALSCFKSFLWKNVVLVQHTVWFRPELLKTMKQTPIVIYRACFDHFSKLYIPTCFIWMSSLKGRLFVKFSWLSRTKSWPWRPKWGCEFS